MAKPPPKFDRLDAFGMAPIHLCAILDRLNDPGIQAIISVTTSHAPMQNCMQFQTDGDKREKFAKGVVNKSRRGGNVKRSPANQISGSIISPVNLGTVDAWQLANLFKSTPPRFHAVRPGNTPAISPHLFWFSDHTPQMIVYFYYLPFALGRGLTFELRNRNHDPGEDYPALFVEEFRTKVIPQYDPARGYSPVTLAMSKLNGLAKNLLTKITGFENQMELNEEHLAQWNGGAPIHLDSTTESADGSAVSIHERIPDPNAEDPAEAVEREMTSRILTEEMAKLDPRERDIFVMHSNNIKQIEIAKTLGLAPNTINDSIRKIRRKLQQQKLIKQFRPTGALINSRRKRQKQNGIGQSRPTGTRIK